MADGLQPSDAGTVIGALIQAIGTIAAGLLAIGAALIGAAALKRQTDRTVAQSERHRAAQEEAHRRRIAGALAGEIGAIVSLIERREMIDWYREYLDPKWQAVAFQRGFFPPPAPVAKEDYLVLYRSLAGEIGVLDADLCNDVARFYVLATSILEQLRAYDREQVQRRLDQMRAIGREAEAQLEVIQSTRVFLADLEDLVARGVPLAERLRKVQGGGQSRSDADVGTVPQTRPAWPFR